MEELCLIQKSQVALKSYIYNRAFDKGVSWKDLEWEAF